MVTHLSSNLTQRFNSAWLGTQWAHSSPFTTRIIHSSRWNSSLMATAWLQQMYSKRMTGRRSIWLTEYSCGLPGPSSALSKCSRIAIGVTSGDGIGQSTIYLAFSHLVLCSLLALLPSICMVVWRWEARGTLFLDMFSSGWVWGCSSLQSLETLFARRSTCHGTPRAPWLSESHTDGLAVSSFVEVSSLSVLAGIIFIQSIETIPRVAWFGQASPLVFSSWFWSSVRSIIRLNFAEMLPIRSLKPPWMLKNSSKRF